MRFRRFRMGVLERFARRATAWTGSSWAFGLAMLVIVVWAVTGPMFNYSDTWQLVINTGTTIVTFLMVFLIQRAQNKDSLAIHLKLNELVAAVHGASNRLINVEEQSEDEVAILKRYYKRLIELARQDVKLTECHSIEEAAHRHQAKQSRHAHGENWDKPTSIEKEFIEAGHQPPMPECEKKTVTA
jgi:low affinity Fe/Cu permease